MDWGDGWGRKGTHFHEAKPVEFAKGMVFGIDIMEDMVEDYFLFITLDFVT